MLFKTYMKLLVLKTHPHQEVLVIIKKKIRQILYFIEPNCDQVLYETVFTTFEIAHVFGRYT